MHLTCVPTATPTATPNETAYVLVTIETECNDEEQEKIGYVSSERACSYKCKDKSPWFVYGNVGDGIFKKDGKPKSKSNRCLKDGSGCMCYCETLKDATGCNQKTHVGYNLYMVDSNGNGIGNNDELKDGNFKNAVDSCLDDIAAMLIRYARLCGTASNSVHPADLAVYGRA